MRRRVGMLRFATQDLCEAKNPGSVINNCGGYVQSAVHEFDGLKSGNKVKAEIHDVRRDKPRLASRRLLTPQILTLIS